MGVGFDAVRFGLVKRLEGADQQDDRDVLKRRIILNRFAQLVAVFAGHENVCQH